LRPFPDRRLSPASSRKQRTIAQVDPDSGRQPIHLEIDIFDHDAIAIAFADASTSR